MASSPAPQHADLADAIDDVVSRDLAHRRWPRALKDLYLTETKDRRRRDLRFLQVTTLLVCLACLALDATVSAELFQLGLLLRIGLVAPAFVAAILCAGKSVGLQFWANTVALSMFAGVATYLGLQAPPAFGDRYIMAAALLVGLSMFILPFTLVKLALTGMAGVGAIIAGAALGGAFQSGLYTDLIAFVAGACGAMLFIVQRTARLKDRNFLLAVKRRMVEAQLIDANAQLTALSNKDSLTGLANRRSFEQLFDEAYRAAIASNENFALLMIDLDRFKAFNDTYGHSSGDECLRSVGTVLASEFSDPNSQVARFGGEEFIGFLRGRTKAAVVQFADRLRSNIAAQDICIGDDRISRVTASIGVAFPEREPGTRMSLVERADEALYDAKRSGRDRVAIAGDVMDDEVRLQAAG